MKVERLLKKDTPYYLYDLGLLRDTLDNLCAEARKHDNFVVHYAIKANANPLILNEIKNYGLGIDCVSGGELNACLKAGFSPNDIVFAGVAKTDKEIEAGIDNGIFSFNVESIPELEVINEIAGCKGKKANVCLRINPNVDAHTHDKITTGLEVNKFGLSKQNLEQWINTALSLENIQLRGLHFHIGSQIIDMSPFKELCIEINEIQERLDTLGIQIEIINVGGGLGINYESPESSPIPDFKAYFETFANNLKLRTGQQLHFELGRAIVAQCGSLVTKVLYVKDTPQKTFVMVDAGMTELIRPALYDAHHHIDKLDSDESAYIRTRSDKRLNETNKYDIVGPICESSDVFAEDYPLPHIERGDLLAIRSAGAYGEVMASCYNCRPLPPSYSMEQLS